jgi:rubrerythrin
VASRGTSTRRGLLALAAGGVALSACGDEPATGPRAPSRSSQAATLNSALAFEHAVIAAYRAGDPLVRGRARARLREITAQERDFARQLAALVRRYGGEPAQPRSEPEYRRSFPLLTAAEDVLTFAADLERRSVRKFLEALPRLSGPEPRRPLAEIAVAQGRHLAVVRALAGEPPAPDAFVTGTE